MEGSGAAGLACPSVPVAGRSAAIIGAAVVIIENPVGGTVKILELSACYCPYHESDDDGDEYQRKRNQYVDDFHVSP